MEMSQPVVLAFLYVNESDRAVLHFVPIGRPVTEVPYPTDDRGSAEDNRVQVFHP
jgi:hypothetical protein